MAAADYDTVVQQLYVAYFGRPADVDGLANFTAALDATGVEATAAGVEAAYNSNATIKALVDSFGTSDESIALYGSGTEESFVFAVYENVLNRVPDQEGFDFWVSAIKNGVLSQGNAALSIMAGALANDSEQGQADAALVNARITVATNFTTAITTENATYSGDAAAASAREMLATVTASTDVTEFQSTIVSTLASITNPGAGSTFTLTTAANAFTGTSGNDTFDASTTADTLGADTLIDASTTDADVLNVLTTSGTAIAPTAVANVETINLTGKFGQASLNMASVTGTTTVNLESSIDAGSATLTGVNSVSTIASGAKVTTLAITGGTTGSSAATINAAAATSVTVTDGSSTTAESYTVNMSKVGTLNMTGANANGTNTFVGNLVAGSNTVVLTGGTGTDTFTLNTQGGATALTGSTAIETLNLGSAGATNTVTLATAGVKTGTSGGKIVASGDQSLTLQGLAAADYTGVTFTDSTTGGTTTIKMTNAGAAAADLSKIGADVIQFVATTNNTAAVTLNDGQNVTWTDGTASVKIAASATSDTLNVTADSAVTGALNVQFEDGGTDFTNIKFTSDRTSTGQTTTLTAIMSEADTTLTILGSGKTTIGATSVAKHIDASGATGSLTVATDADIQKVTTGAGGSTITIGDVDPSGNYTVTGGSGNDTVKFGGLGTFDSTAGNTFTIDAGTGGTDVLQLTGATDFTTTTGLNAAIVTGFEQIDVNGQTLTFTQKQIFTNGGTFTLNDTAGGGTFIVTVDTDSGSAVVDLSSVAFTGGVAAPAVQINALAGVANTLTGTSSADSITGGTGNDVLSGNGGVDTITGGTGVDVMTGGAGNDVFMYSATNETGVATAAASTSTATLDILNVAAGDTINLAATLSTEADYDVLGTLATSGSITLTGLVAGGGANDLATVARVQGVYDSAANTFTVGSSGANAVLISWADDDGTTATDSIVLVGVTDVTSIANGVLTV